MHVRYRSRGFTLIELLTATGLLVIFIALATLEINHLTHASRSIARGSGELLATTRFAEQFRDDVHQARRVEVLADGAAVRLCLAADTITYYINDDGRVERAAPATGELSTGPCVDAVHFELNAAKPPGRTLLRTRWDCLAAIDPTQDPSDPARAQPRVLVLDTALRSETPEDP